MVTSVTNKNKGKLPRGVRSDSMQKLVRGPSPVPVAFTIF